ncbi:MAG: S41 family peptidase [Capnocytophaga sp.]|nr:S41 family peptidase [Capnocytophaga sp.]
MKKISLLFLSAILFWSCEKDADDEIGIASLDTEIKDFVWKGMNTYYLWQGEVPNLADNRFASTLQQTLVSSNASYRSFLESYAGPAELFAALQTKQDRFSYITDDYEILENNLQGISLGTGMDFGLTRYDPNNQNLVLGYVRYVLPDTDAERKGIRRGDIFMSVDGSPITTSNYRSLLFNDNTSMNLGVFRIQNGALTPVGDFLLLKQQINENPIYINKTFAIGNHKIGYLMYNGFVNSYDVRLNEVFAQFKSEGITDLILDLRYNSGGHISSSVYLASMITGQFNGKLFAKERWNSKLQSVAEEFNRVDNFFTNTIHYGNDNASTQAINSLALTRVYILTSGSTASASELVINGLAPYIDVNQIGATTTGKNQGSITVYDYIDNNGTKNPKHKWAMQPLVLQIENAVGFGEYTTGLTPDITIEEDLSAMGVLGETSEPLLARAIAAITGNGKYMPKPAAMPAKPFASTKTFQIGVNDMVSDKKIKLP